MHEDERRILRDGTKGIVNETRNISTHDMCTAVKNRASERTICYVIPSVQDLRVDSRPIKYYKLDSVIKYQICKRLYILIRYFEI